ncbi:carboxypeptidase regulatory-like domain-containing protein [Myxococcus sp. Y35]|uniref:carboxypeptidase regulatory-like domain-containing protein n=1 Tax=Pseudomyxococcus flavus TaxID=3115648 RepID=UPI003CEEFE7A
MKRPLLMLSCVLLGLSPGCGPGDSTPDPGVQTEDAETVDLDNLRIGVSGSVDLLPEARRLLEARGLSTPSLAAAPLTLAEPLRLAVNDPNATFGTSPVSEDGTFTISDVPVREMHLSLVAGVEAAGLVRAHTVVYDAAFTGARPRTDLIDVRVWALPEAFHNALSVAVGEGTIRGHTANQAGTLRDAGFVLGRVVDAAGLPVAGAKVAPDREDLAGRIYYPSADFSTAGQAGTGPDGLFVYVHSGLDADTFLLSVEGLEGYVPRNVGVAPGWGLVLTLHPGLYPPP